MLQNTLENADGILWTDQTLKSGRCGIAQQLLTN